MFSRAIRATFLDRRAHKEAFFDDDAAADGVILYALVGAASYLIVHLRIGSLRFFSITGLLRSAIVLLIGWLVMATSTWFVAGRLFGSTLRRPQLMIGLHGLGALPLLLDAGGQVLGGIGLLWHLAILTVATEEASSLDLRRSAASVLIGFAVVTLIRMLLQVPFAVFG